VPIAALTGPEARKAGLDPAALRLGLETHGLEREPPHRVVARRLGGERLDPPRAEPREARELRDQDGGALGGEQQQAHDELVARRSPQRRRSPEPALERLAAAGCGLEEAAPAAPRLERRRNLDGKSPPPQPREAPGELPLTHPPGRTKPLL
jgi:hypothetical protein